MTARRDPGQGGFAARMDRMEHRKFCRGLADELRAAYRLALLEAVVAAARNVIEEEEEGGIRAWKRGHARGELRAAMRRLDDLEEP